MNPQIRVFYFLLVQFAHLYLHTCVLPRIPTDGVARIFFLAPMLPPGIEPTLALWHLFEGLSYPGRGTFC